MHDSSAVCLKNCSVSLPELLTFRLGAFRSATDKTERAYSSAFITGMLNLFRAAAGSAVNEYVKKEIKFKCVQTERRFASSENTEFIDMKKRYFIFDLKQNRLVALNGTDRKNGVWTNISELKISEDIPVKVF